jgi:hypothetical protein
MQRTDHERDDYWEDGNGRDICLVHTRYEKERRGGGVDKEDWPAFRSRTCAGTVCHHQMTKRR